MTTRAIEMAVIATSNSYAQLVDEGHFRCYGIQGPNDPPRYPFATRQQRLRAMASIGIPRDDRNAILYGWPTTRLPSDR